MTRRAIVAKTDGFGYGGTHRFAGEIIDLRGLTNDARLVDIGYLTDYDRSAHDHSDEVEELGRRFISQGHRLTFLQQLKEREREERSRLTRVPTRDDERQMETQALERRGLQLTENAGARTFTRGVLSEPQLELCPVEGCEERVAVLDMREHVATHGTSPKSAEPEDVLNLECDVCGFTAKNPGGLATHARKHAKERTTA